jgi:hypothetical protein
MPISKTEFESGQVLSEIERNILTFLARNRGNAYTMGEIMDGINLQTNFNDLWKAIVSGIAVAGFQSILNNLVVCEKVRMNVIQGIYYYMAK